MKKQGFTLVELLAVIVILGMLTAIVVPNISGSIDRASKASLKLNAQSVLKQIGDEKLKNRNFNETSVDELNITAFNLSNDNYQDLEVKLVNGKPYIIIIGKNKWDGLKVCGTKDNMTVVNVDDTNACSTDSVPPLISLIGDAVISIQKGQPYTDAGATVVDDVDGDITSKINTTGEVNVNLAGSYTITYSVSDNAGNISSITRTVNVIPQNYSGPSYISSKGVNGPVLAQGMIPIKWNGNDWVDTDIYDVDWYSYTTTDKKWANARTADRSMWVWIPRYIYKISTGWHTSTVGTIDVQFSNGVDDNWNSATIGNISTDSTADASNNTWTNHPAFWWDNDSDGMREADEELMGIWVAKFEASVNVIDNDIDFKPNVSSLHDMTVSEMFTAARNMETKSRYGWTLASGLNPNGTFTTDTNNLDTHMMKNVEWGVVAYLSKSIYGKNIDEIWINPADDHKTGCAGDSVSSGSTTGCLRTYEKDNGMKASTTGNIHGIYDMSGGNDEYTAAYISNDHPVLSAYGDSIISADVKYKNTYNVIWDTSIENYKSASSRKGDAIYETSGLYATSWFADNSIFPDTGNPWFTRGNIYSQGESAGVFEFSSDMGDASLVSAFRVVVIVGNGL